MKEEKRTPVIRWIVTGLSAVLLTVSLLPLIINGICNIGVTVPTAVAVLGLVIGLCPPAAWQKGGRAMLIALIAAICVIALLAAVLTGCMLRAATRPAPEGATVVVLGCGIYDNRPSRMMKARLEAAVGYLEAHPGSACVVSGGQGENEICTEAAVMEKYLILRGIAPERIFREERSTDTRENLRYSMELIREKGLPADAAIATQRFHQYRAGQWALREGASSVGALSCRSPYHLMLCYWVRECAAICRLWILGR